MTRKTPMLPKPEEQTRQTRVPAAVGAIVFVALLIASLGLLAQPSQLQVDRAGEEATAPARVSATARPTEQATATPPPTDIPTWTPLPTIEAQGAPVVEEQPQGAVEPPPEAAPVDAPLPPTPLVYSPCAWWHPPMEPSGGCP